MAKSKIKAMSDDELKGLSKEVADELHARREERLKKERIEHAERLKALLPYKDAILQMLEHDRTSCSDENPCNGIEDKERYRCAKCALMELLEMAEWSPESDWYVHFHVDLTRIV